MSREAAGDLLACGRESLRQLGQRRGGGGMPRDQKQVAASGNMGLMKAKNFTQPTFGAIALHCASNGLG